MSPKSALRQQLGGKYWIAIAAICAAILSCVLLLGLSNYHGVCVEKLEKLKDVDLINHAIHGVITGPVPSVHLEAKELGPGLSETTSKQYMLARPKEPIYYKSVEEFKSLNPDCCRIAGPYEFDDPYPDVYSRLIGVRAALIVVNYKFRYQADSEIIEKKINLLLKVSNCGCIL